MTPRKFRLSQKSVVTEVAGTYMLMYVFSDLSNEELQYQLNHFLDKEDYEYCDALKAEAQLRGIKLRVKKS